MAIATPRRKKNAPDQLTIGSTDDPVLEIRTAQTGEIDGVRTTVTRIVPAPPTGRYLMAPISIVEVDPGFNNRRDLGDVAELAESIKSVGLLEPLLVWLQPVPGTQTEPHGYLHVIAGHRRLAAAKVAGLTHVPVIVTDLDERGRLEALLVENLHRKDIDPLEEADGYRRLVDLGLSQRDVSEKVGRSQSHVSKRLSLLELPEEAREAVVSGGITLPDALELLKLKDHPSRLATALKNAGNWGGAERAVEHELRELEWDAKRNAALAKLSREGVTLIKADQYGGPPSNYPLVGASWGVNMPIKEHAKLSCHAAFVRPTGEVEFRCMDPKAHLDSPDVLPEHLKREVAGPATRQETIEQNRAIRAGIQRRRDYIRELLAKPRRGETETFMLAGLVAGADQAQGRLQIAAELLGIKTNGYESHKALLALAAKSKDDLYRVCLAIAFAQGETVIERGGWVYTAANAITLLDFLKTTGFEEQEQEAEARRQAAAALKERVDLGEACATCGGEIDVFDAQAGEEVEAWEAAETNLCIQCWLKTQAPEDAPPLRTRKSAAVAAAPAADALIKKAARTKTEDKVCRVCGCTEDKACPGGCVWVEATDAGWLCSECS